jgi:putative transposase
MQRLQAFKYELMPDGNQQRDMRRFAGSCRFVFNKALALQKANHEAGNKFIRYVEMANQLPAWKSEFAWLKESPSQALQHALKNLDRAFTNFFEKRAEYPCFKKRGYGDSFRFPQGFKLDQANSRIFLPKLGWVRYRNSREILGTVSNVTVSSRNGKWFLSIQTEREVEQPVAQGDAVGIDLGVVRFATLSNGTVIPPLSIFKRYAAELRKTQQAMSRKKKFSNNWKKAKAKVQRIHVRIANARRDYLHKTSTAISKNHAMVVVEDLKVKNMSRSATGRYSTRAGRNFVANWSTKCSGRVACSSLYQRRILPAHALNAAMSQQTTADPKRSSPASNAATPKMPIWSVQSMF